MALSVDQKFKEGVNADQAGNVDKADTCYLAVLNAEPKHPDANHNMGVLALGGGKPIQALAFFKVAIDVNPNIDQFWISYISTLIFLGRSEDASAALDLVRANGAKGDAFDQLAKRLSQMSSSDVVACNPAPEQLQPLLDLYHQGKFQQCLTLASQMQKSFSSSEVLLDILGAVSAALKNFDKALECYQKVLEIHPTSYFAHNNLGNVLVARGDAKSAIISYRRALGIKPDFVDAYYNMGTALNLLGDLNGAIDAYTRALELKPGYAKIHNNLGAVLREKGDIDGAITSCKRALNIDPDYVLALINIAQCFKAKYELVAARESFEKALAKNPKLAEAQEGYASILAYMSDWDDVIKHSDLAISLEDTEEIWESRLYTWIYHPDLSAEMICNEHIRWGERFPEIQDVKFTNHDRGLNRRLRIGYVSPDFRANNCRFYYEPLFSRHDREHYELFAYSNVRQEDGHTQRFKTYFDTWRNIRDVSDGVAFDIVRGDKIDILIDGCGHMEDTRLGLFALKPAPIQVTWLGAAWTTGLKQMDYAVFDPYMAPPEIETSEEVIRLPKTWACYRPGSKAISADVTILPALKNGYITFGYSGRTERLNYKVFGAWGEVLNLIPDAKLIIDWRCFSDFATRQYFFDLIAKFGVDVSRVTLRNSSNIFEALGEIDILLDSFPHSGGTMLFDALWMGVPTITLASRPSVGRVGTSLMTNLDLAHWVADDECSYIAKAVAFEKDFHQLSQLRSTMRERMIHSPVMNEKGFASDVESAYQKIWREWCQNTDGTNS